MQPAHQPATSPADQGPPLEGAWPEPDERPPPFGIWVPNGSPPGDSVQSPERAKELPASAQVDSPTRPRTWLTTAAPAVLSVAAMAMWVLGTGQVDLRHLTDVGLASVLPIPVLVAPVLATVGFIWTLRQRPMRQSILLFHVVTLVVMLYGMNAMVEPVPGLNVVWRHAGIADYIARTGAVDPRIDAYFNWPGFFMLAAFLTSAAGLESILPLAAWAPVFFNLLYLGPLFLFYRQATSDRRLTWLAIWIFYATNWIHQDYIAPQALCYFLYLLILPILTGTFRTYRTKPFALLRLLPWPRAGPANDRPVWNLSLDAQRPQEGPLQRAGLMAVVIIVFAATVPSHQLTPFVILASVSALVIAGRCSARGLPLLMAVMLVAWMTFMSAGYLSGHLSILSEDVGQVDSIAAANVGDRLHGSDGHQLVVQLRLALTALLWGLAALGWLRRRRRGQDDMTVALLAIAPFPFLLLQPYGGELLLRVYFFTLPFVAFAAAGLFLPVKRNAPSWRTTGAIGLAVVTLLGGFLFARYGNERMEYFTTAEITAVRHLYDIAPSGSLLLAATPTVPWKYRDYTGYKYRSIGSLKRSSRNPGSLAKPVVDTMAQHPRPGAYFIITRSQVASSEAMGVLSPEALVRLERALQRSRRVELVYANQDARIYTLRRGAPR